MNHSPKHVIPITESLPAGIWDHCYSSSKGELQNILLELMVKYNFHSLSMKPRVLDYFGKRESSNKSRSIATPRPPRLQEVKAYSRQVPDH